MRKYCWGRVKPSVPADVSDISSPNDVLHNPPLASDLVQKGHHVIVERPGVVSVSIGRVTIIDGAAIGSLRCGQEKGPAILSFQVIDSEDDFLL